jgi:hypothetical protein
VCGSATKSAHGHHVVPRASGGSEGPVVDLCGDCHTVVHSAAKRMGRGKSPDDLLSHLDDGARGRAQLLIQVILTAELGREGSTNPRPVLAVQLHCPIYMKAIDMAARDRGFTSREGFINGLARSLAQGYGLLAPPAPTASEKRGLQRLSSAFPRTGKPGQGVD